MDISVKSISELIDSLITISMKCWFAQEDLMNESLPEIKRLEAAINAQKMNAQRNALMRAINNRLDKEHFSPTEKTYK